MHAGKTKRFIRKNTKKRKLKSTDKNLLIIIIMIIMIIIMTTTTTMMMMTVMMMMMIKVMNKKVSQVCLNLPQTHTICIEFMKNYAMANCAAIVK